MKVEFTSHEKFVQAADDLLETLDCKAKAMSSEYGLPLAMDAERALMREVLLAWAWKLAAKGTT